VPDELSLDSLVAKLFLERRDVKAIQKSTGEYNPVKTKWTRADIQAHLDETRTYGHYLVDPTTERCRVFCFDIDLKAEYRAEFLSADTERVAWLNAELRCFAKSFTERIKDLLGIPTAELFSGNKGVHVYGFTGSEPASDVRDAADLVLQSFKQKDGTPEYFPTKGQHFFGHYSYPEIEVELYPKQKEMNGKEYGNLLRLPLGVNRKSGRKSFFYDTAAPLWEFTPVDPLGVLQNVAEGQA